MSAMTRFLSAVRADLAMLQRYDGKYDERRRPEPLVKAVIERVGLQMMVAYRLMRLARRGLRSARTQVIARMIRLLYGADIHYDAKFEEGVVLVHGMGLAIHGMARVAKGVILSQNVTLGCAMNPTTRAVGAPTLQEDVHVGPGVTILGPVTIGPHSKLMPGAVVRESVPPDGSSRRLRRGSSREGAPRETLHRTALEGGKDAR